MRANRFLFIAPVVAVAAGIAFAQPGRGGSQWLTALADAQRTSWVRSDARISVDALSKPGFELQWKVTLDNQPRGTHGLRQGVTAAGVTLFVPLSVVTGSSNTVYGIDNDIGYVTWRRQFDLPMPTPAAACPGGMTSGATRIVRLDASATAGAPGISFGRANPGYRTLLGEPGEGVPLEGGRGRAGRAGAGGAGRGTAAGRGAGRGAAPPAPAIPAARAGQSGDRIPGAPRREEGRGAFGALFRPSGVVYVITSDGMLHVLGLPSGKDMQRPAPFLPPNARWSSPIAVETMMYAATSGACGGAPAAVWAIDLDSETKPVVSWKTNGGGVVGAVAFTEAGTLIAAIGAGKTSGDGKANAIVALDPKTLQLKDWFTEASAEFVTGPTIVRHHERDIVAAATKDGRVVLLDAASLGGADHATPLFVSEPVIRPGGSVSADALAAWQRSPTETWILLPVSGRPTTTGAASTGGVVALRVTGEGSALSLRPAWASDELIAPATPLIVNGVVFALATGAPSKPEDRGTPAVLHAYDGATGQPLWNSGKAMATFASPGSMWSGLGQIYVGTHDGTLYAFGFDDERSYTNGR
jgi:hypothetical protein